MKTACVTFSIGCPRSNIDAALLVEYFKKNRLKVTTKFQEADIILVSTCGFDIQNENRSIELLSVVNRLKNKNAQIIAFGCLPGINECDDRNVFNLRIATGCNGFCSYCAIKSATGPLNSKPLNGILEEFEDGLSIGYKTFRLIAEDVGAYGQDIGTNIVNLLRELFNNKNKFKLEFSDFSPKWLVQYFPQLYDIFTKNSNRFGLIGLPVQSGSERILELMMREYTVKDAKKCMLALQKACPDLRLETHVIIGFPGETEEDFLDTMEFIKALKVENIWKYKYADRPNTHASTLPGKIPEEIKESRVLRIGQIELQNKSSNLLKTLLTSPFLKPIPKYTLLPHRLYKKRALKGSGF